MQKSFLILQHNFNVCFYIFRHVYHSHGVLEIFIRVCPMQPTGRDTSINNCGSTSPLADTSEYEIKRIRSYRSHACLVSDRPSLVFPFSIILFSSFIQYSSENRARVEIVTELAAYWIVLGRDRFDEIRRNCKLSRWYCFFNLTTADPWIFIDA